MLLKEFPTDLLISWFLNNRRKLPWRENRTAYRVWISEVMLQQTTVTTVVPYFYKWMQIFPNIKSLAAAEEQFVLKTWEGLGYYSRARSLHQGSQVIIKHFDGNFPQEEKDIASIKGIGPYTLNAILAFAFKKKVCPVDGNVLRVLSRFFAIHESILLSKTIKKISDLANSLLPEKDFVYASEGLIELGALICKKKPLCFICPLKNDCLAFQQNLMDILPKKHVKQKVRRVFRIVGIITQSDKFFVIKREGNSIMSGLYEFPYFNVETLEDTDIAYYEELFSQEIKEPLIFRKKLSLQKHSFTSFRATLMPLLLEINENSSCKRESFFSLEELFLLPFSSGHKKILKELAVVFSQKNSKNV